MTALAERVLSVPQTAALLGVSERSCYAAIARGELPGVRIGRRVVVPGAALARLLEGVSDEMSRAGTSAAGPESTTGRAAPRND